MVNRKKPLFSIIIAFHIMKDRFFFDLKKFSNQTIKEYEILVMADRYVNFYFKDKQIRVIEPEKDIKLGEKRDLGYRKSKGEFCAYIDDDAYPDKNWLKNAYQIFKRDPNVGAVGGPNITPPDESFWSKIGGLIYTSYLTSGAQQYRFVPVKRFNDKELQGVNMIIRKSVLDELGGFTNKFNYGDDTKICSEIRKIGYKVISDPKVIVYHHRRSFPFEHLKQIKSIGLHRGYFVRKYPETNAPIYFAPVILAVGFFSSVAGAVLVDWLRLPFIVIFGSFFLLGVLSLRRYAPIHMAFIGSFGIILTHLWYGVFFIKGFFTKHMAY